MADDVDRAQARIENIVAGGIAIAREKAAKVRALVPCGECYYCGHTLRGSLVFCDGVECQNDYYHLMRREEANGL